MTQSTIRSPSIFSALPPEMRAILLANAVRRQFADGQVIQQRGDPPDGFWIVEKGMIKIGNYDADGNMHSLYMSGEGSSIGELACIGGFPKVTAAEAVGNVELSWVGEAQFSAFVRSSAEARVVITKTLAGQLQEALNGIMEMRHISAPKRVAGRLLALSRDKPEPVRVAIKQQELAELVNASRVTVGQTLADLEAAGILTREYGHILVRDVDKLGRWIRT